MQDHSSFNASYDMGSNLENRFCHLAAHCATNDYLLIEKLHGRYAFDSTGIHINIVN
jgi:hypothetical protein